MPLPASSVVLRWRKAYVKGTYQREMGLEFGEWAAEGRNRSKYTKTQARKVINSTELVCAYWHGWDMAGFMVLLSSKGKCDKRGSCFPLDLNYERDRSHTFL